LITFGTLGRLGRFANGLFQISGTLGLAIHRGYAYAFPEWKNHDHKERFGSAEDIDLQKYFITNLPRTDAQLPQFNIPWGFHPDIFDHLPDNVSLWGHMQSEKYFKHCLPLVRRVFRMHGEGDHWDAVAIHVRRGDYDNAYHPRIGLEYYEPAIKQFPQGTKFIVFSDEQNKARELLKPMEGHGEFIYSPLTSYLEDFRWMKVCRHFIIANSSFSLMAAILGDSPDKKIVCPSNWFGQAWGQRPETKDLYPENSIII
jgi:hypothetical protein